MLTIDLNCDMGESYGVYNLGEDKAAMPLVTSANVACGFHASDPDNMMKTVRLAKQNGVAVGAHPSYPDLVGFGRRQMALSNEEIEAAIIYQLGALQGFCQAEGVAMQHVKVHGALYNKAEKDAETSLAIAKAIQKFDPKLIMVCMANSEMTKAAKAIGLPYAEEVFADRAYTAQGALAGRKLPGAVIHDVDEVVARVMKMVQQKTVTTLDGTELPINADTICVHGDTPGAVEMISRIRSALEAAGIQLKAMGSK